MPGQKRKAEDVSDVTATSAKKLKTITSDDDKEVKLIVDFGDSTGKVYDIISFTSNPNYLTEKETNMDENEEADSKSHRQKRSKAQTKVDPLHDIGDGSRVEFDTGFVLQRDGDQYTCTCNVFKGKIVDTTRTSCQHFVEYLGEDFESRRMAKKKTSVQNHVSVNVLLAHKFDEKETNPASMWMSEKLDGVRGIWNGRCFYSRLGNAFHAPSWFTKDLPRDMTLDGELFGGRGQFQDTVRVVKSGPDADWSTIKFHVFDSPSICHEPFEKRMEAIIAMFKRKRPGHATFVPHTQCKGLKHLNEMCDKVLSYGGEGIMLRAPRSVYEFARSKTLLKMKKFYDAEAVVIGHERGKGSNAYRCGALRCRMACGKEFSVGSGLTNKDRNNPPKIGSIITYKFQELTKSGVPRFPSYLGIRIDMTSPKDAIMREVVDE